eukprot:m.223686 g.223686  ORF g.223686 m.223686 type:complete len:78 (+) comp39983_c0_seq19:1929-2162(+)
MPFFLVIDYTKSSETVCLCVDDAAAAARAEEEEKQAERVAQGGHKHNEGLVISALSGERRPFYRFLAFYVILASLSD